MASTREYLDYILEQLGDLKQISYRAMMGEFILYYKGKIIGGIYDNRLLVKSIPAAISYMSNVRFERPYEGAKEMICVDEIDDKSFLTGLFDAMADALPAPKSKATANDKKH